MKHEELIRQQIHAIVSRMRHPAIEPAWRRLVRIAVGAAVLATSHAIAYMADLPTMPFLGVW